ncbi:uncharacterized protein I303_104896 [Kwoniella dejecticola CBS 10117]|uniref:Phosphatidyl-N-methylethanolamine N-methyltransferase n=1 Tax=Kwoniella dejecticola CBS 10117 TaxID=1296121 RepID=A0A1A6A417_9TREE|nr:methylene-fatty-acyl-phospholipid synthase [Kwoniella dejecticola CBS 10117]OBR84799.1 methylene-fatty-acyl-phospholipid synthase [Kwoniella dejecticola CBS 10117]
MSKSPFGSLTIPSWLPGQDLLNPQYKYASAGPALFELDKLSLWAFVAMTAFNPIFWNSVARNEYRNKTITKIVGSPLVGTYILALTIFSISFFRDHLFLNALKNQPSLIELGTPLVKLIAIILFVSGQTFVLSSMWALGVTGTYLGDYFGILMSHRVTSFPFNVLSDPMYVGSFLTHLGTALWYQSPVGIVLAGWVYLVYSIALRYEGPFTDKIYSAKAQQSKQSPSSKKSQTTANAKDSETYASATSTSTPATPSRRSGRIATRKSLAGASDLDSSDAESKSITATGRKSRSSALNQELHNAAGSDAKATPARSTRSRSKPRVVDDSD